MPSTAASIIEITAQPNQQVVNEHVLKGMRLRAEFDAYEEAEDKLAEARGVEPPSTGTAPVAPTLAPGRSKGVASRSGRGTPPRENAAEETDRTADETRGGPRTPKGAAGPTPAEKVAEARAKIEARQAEIEARMKAHIRRVNRPRGS